VRPRTWILAFGFALLSIGLGQAWEAGWFDPPPPPLVDSPEAVVAGRAVFAYRCTSCHRDVPLQKRVAGWSPEKAYETIGRLPKVAKANMHAFPGTEEDRRALALFLSALGAGRATQPNN
jgi:mono/diheme cytochrome c family protein